MVDFGRGVVDLDARELREVATGLGFTESPVWTDQARLLVASVNRGAVYEVFLDGRPPVHVAETGGGPNGLASAGTDVFVCQNGGLAMPSRSKRLVRPAVQRIDRGGQVTEWSSGPYHSPSDGVIGPDGRLWITDPTSHALDEDASPGRVWALDPSTGDPTLMLDGILFPNGIAFSPDGEMLYVAESATRRVHRFTAVDGVWTRHDWRSPPLPGVPDGLAVDREGGVWVGCSFGGAVVRLALDGAVSHVLRTGDSVLPTAVCFAGPERDQLVITSPKGGAVFAMRSPMRGTGPFASSVAVP